MQIGQNSNSHRDAAQDAQGALELAKRFTVICLPEDTYEVPSAALAMLDDRCSFPIVS